MSEDILAGLRDTVERAHSKAKAAWLDPAPWVDHAAHYAAMIALEHLYNELPTPKRDGAGAPRADLPGGATPAAAESATTTPAPSLPTLCGARHPMFDLECTRVHYHVFGDTRLHHSAVHGVWWQ